MKALGLLVTFAVIALALHSCPGNNEAHARWVAIANAPAN